MGEKELAEKLGISESRAGKIVKNVAEMALDIGALDLKDRASVMLEVVEKVVADDPKHNDLASTLRFVIRELSAYIEKHLA